MARRESPAEAWERMRSASPASSAPAPAWEPPPTPQSPPPAAQPAAARPSEENADDAGAARSSYWDRGPAQAHEEANGRSGTDLQDTSAGDLVHRLTDQTKTLVRQEMKLAQVELKEKGKKAGIGIGMFGAGGLAAFFGVGVLLAAIVLALSTFMAAWLGALIVAAVLLAVAGVFALMGKKKIEEATPPAPEQAVGSVKRDVETVKRSARR